MSEGKIFEFPIGDKQPFAERIKAEIAELEAEASEAQEELDNIEAEKVIDMEDFAWKKQSPFGSRRDILNEHLNHLKELLKEKNQALDGLLKK